MREKSQVKIHWDPGHVVNSFACGRKATASSEAYDTSAMRSGQRDKLMCPDCLALYRESVKAKPKKGDK